ncbi:MAG: HPr family phosphocarrier protein [Candidatus Izimaplasma sp.]|nr:HPr family phosphocarrier protein [Candidatus Izimaplasma bacterium]
MVSKTFKVKDEAGLHARPASILCKKAMTFSGDVHIVYKKSKSTLKSIMILMSLGIPYEAEFAIEVDGDGETEMLQELTDILEEHNLIE